MVMASRFGVDSQGKLQKREEQLPWEVHARSGRLGDCQIQLLSTTLGGGAAGEVGEAEAEPAPQLVALTVKEYAKTLVRIWQAASQSQERAQIEAAAQASALGTLLNIVGISTELFGGPVAVEQFVDPEFPDEKKAVFIAEVSADAEAVLKLESEWVRRVSSLEPYWDGFRLKIKRKK